MPAIQMLVGYTVAGFTGFFITIASLPAWLVGHGTAAALAGLTTTVLLVTTVGLQMFVPHLVQRLGPGVILTAGLLGLGGPSLLLLVDNGLGWVMAICAVRGAGFGILTVLGATMAARTVSVERRGEAIGIHGLAISLPNLLAIPGGVALVAADQFHWVAIIGAVPLLGLATVPSLVRHIDLSTPTAGGNSSRAARRAAGLAAASPAVILLAVTLAGGGFSTFLPIARPQGTLATSALLVWGIAAAGARWRVGSLADRSGTALLLPVASALTVVGMGILVCGLVMESTAGSMLILIGSAALGIGFGAAQSLTLVAALARARQREPATVSSVWNIGFDMGTALGAALVGALASAIEIPGALAVTAVLVGATIPLAVARGGAGRAR